MMKKFNFFTILFTAFLCSAVSSVYSQGITVDIGSTLSINDGILNVPQNITINGTLSSTTGTINAGGDFANNGIFIPGTGTVNFIDGQTPANILGNSQFHNLGAITTSGKQVNFEAGKTQTVSNSLILQGAPGNLLALRSTVTGSQGIINLLAGGSQAIDHVNVMDHNASGQYLANGTPASFNSVDSGNNTRWFQTGEPTLVFLTTFTAKEVNLEIVLEWTTASEIDNEGFNILRSESEEGEYNIINNSIIVSKGALFTETRYEFIDSNTVDGVTYYYKLEDIDLKGKATTSGPLKVIMGFVPEVIESSGNSEIGNSVIESVPNDSNSDLTESKSCFIGIVK